METKHTPGPWKVSQVVPNSELPKGKRKTGYSGSIGYVWTDRPYPGGVCLAEVRGHYVGEEEANARLIAAAPDLLAALEAVNGMLDNFPGFDSRAVPFTDKATGNIGQVVRAAIARATTTN